MNRTIIYWIALLMIWSGNPLYGEGIDLDLKAMLSPVPSEAKFQDKDYFIWGGSMVRDPEGKCHLFYSRWPRNKGFSA